QIVQQKLIRRSQVGTFGTRRKWNLSRRDLWGWSGTHHEFCFGFFRSAPPLRLYRTGGGSSQLQTVEGHLSRGNRARQCRYRNLLYLERRRSKLFGHRFPDVGRCWATKMPICHVNTARGG